MEIIALLFVVLCRVDHITSTDTQDHRYPGFLFDNHPGYILSLPTNAKVKQMSTKVSSKMDCVFACVGQPWCRSVNFKIAAEKDGRHICEMIATDNYTHPNHLKKEEKFTHLNIKNPCEGHPCLNKGTCVPLKNRLDYRCKCKKGYTGNNCQNDVDECLGSHGCHSDANCVNSPGSFRCQCKPGFTGTGKMCRDVDECLGSHGCHSDANCVNRPGSFRCQCKPGFSGNGKTCRALPRNCAEIFNSGARQNGVYKLRSSSHKTFQAYCDMGGRGWTLISRNSNRDSKNWMRDDGFWWYDEMTSQGSTTSTSVNQDMISPAFWSVTGSEIKITRSDDSTHTALLRTTSNCLGSRTFRSKITSYGDFRNGAVWANNNCLGSCSVVYGGQYSTTDGFSQAHCGSNIQGSYKIGFWCDWDSGDGAVMMIGGGGSDCNRADHGIGITEENAAAFATTTNECDFGEEANTCPSSVSYALNLWIR